MTTTESNFAKLLELLFITANQIAYPQSAPPNTPNRTPPSQQRKYPFWDYRNLTDNQGWLKINIDMTQYKSKKFYLDASQQVVENHLKALEKKQNLLKSFKHYEDFDRIDAKNAQNTITFENQIQKMLFGHFFLAAYLARVHVINQYYHHFSFTLFKKTFFKTYFASLPLVLLTNLFFQQSNPVNHEYFRSNTQQMRMYQGVAYDLDTYRDVNDIKYSFKYPERKDFYKTVWEVYDKKVQHKYQDSIEYYKRVYGIVDPQPFWNKNKSSHEDNDKSQ